MPISRFVKMAKKNSCLIDVLERHANWIGQGNGGGLSDDEYYLKLVLI